MELFIILGILCVCVCVSSDFLKPAVQCVSPSVLLSHTSSQKTVLLFITQVKAESPCVELLAVAKAVKHSML